MPLINIAERIDTLPVSGLQWRVVIVCALVAILDGFDTQAIAFVGPSIAKEFGSRPTELGVVFAAGLAGLMVGALIFSPVADRIGRKPVIILSCLIFGSFALASTLARSIEMLAALRFLTGLGLGAAMPNINILTAEYAPARHRATLMTIMFVGFPFGAVVGGLISSPLIEHFGWRSVFLVGGFAPLLLALLIFPMLPESMRYLARAGNNNERLSRILNRIDPNYTPRTNDQFSPGEQESAVGVASLFAKRQAGPTLLLWLIFFANLLILYGLLNWLPLVMRSAGLPLDRAILATVVLNIGGVIGGLALAWAIDRFGAVKILTGAYSGVALFVALIGWASASWTGLMIVLFLAGGCIIGSQFGINAVAANQYPTTARSTGLGWALAVGRMGAVLGPLAIAAMVEMGLGIQWLFLAVATPALIAIAALRIFVVIRQRDYSGRE